MWIHSLLIPSCPFEQFKATGGKHIDPTLQDNVFLPSDFAEHINQTRSNAIILYNTLPAVGIEKVVMRKPGEELYSTKYQSRTLPKRIVLKPNLQCGRQDTTSSETCGGGTYKETCRGEIYFRIQGLPHSADQEHVHIRKEAVQKLIHQFETYPNKEALRADLKQNHAFNPFSAQSKEIICSMGNMEYLRFARSLPTYSAA